MHRLIGIAGATASGKTTVARGLIEHFKADTNRFSSILAAIATETNLQTDKETLQKLSTSLRSHLGEDVLARGMCAWVKSATAETIVIEGLRRKTDIELLGAVARETNRTWTFIYVDLPFEMRFERFKKRDGDVSLEAFEALDTQECEQELPALREESHLILNTTHPPQEVLAEAITYLNR